MSRKRRGGGDCPQSSTGNKLKIQQILISRHLKQKRSDCELFTTENEPIQLCTVCDGVALCVSVRSDTVYYYYVSAFFCHVM